MFNNHGEEIGRPPAERSVRKRTRTGRSRSIKDAEEIEEELESLPRIGSLARTRRLLLAALKVWELKHGIRD
jgi:hypothetical protein